MSFICSPFHVIQGHQQLIQFNQFIVANYIYKKVVLVLIYLVISYVKFYVLPYLITLGVRYQKHKQRICKVAPYQVGRDMFTFSQLGHLLFFLRKIHSFTFCFVRCFKYLMKYLPSIFYMRNITLHPHTLMQYFIVIFETNNYKRHISNNNIIIR